MQQRQAIMAHILGAVLLEAVVSCALAYDTLGKLQVITTLLISVLVLLTINRLTSIN